MTDPFEQSKFLINAVEAAQRAFAPTQAFADQIAKSTAYLTARHSGIEEAIHRMQIRQELFEPSQAIERMVAQMAAAEQMSNRLAESFRSTITAIDRDTGRWRRMVDSLVAQQQRADLFARQAGAVANSIIAWESSVAKLAQQITDTGLFTHRIELSTRLFAPSHAFADFAAATVVKIENARNDRQAWALETSLRASEEQLIATTDTLRAIVVVPGDDEDVSTSRPLRAPYIQQEELVVAVAAIDSDDEASLIEASPAARAVDITREVLSQVALCNEASKVARGIEVFKPTTKLLEVYTDLPWMVPIDKASFALFVDCLYFLFYEAAGKDNLRFLKSHGGPIDDGDFEFILCVKHLRNKWLRHDPDHGNDSAITKSWGDLAKQFQWLGLQRLPITPEDFRLLHVNLLVQARNFASKVLHGIVV